MARVLFLELEACLIYDFHLLAAFVCFGSSSQFPHFYLVFDKAKLEAAVKDFVFMQKRETCLGHEMLITVALFSFGGILTFLFRLLLIQCS